MYIIVSNVTHDGLCVPTGTLVEWERLLDFYPDLEGHIENAPPDAWIAGKVCLPNGEFEIEFQHRNAMPVRWSVPLRRIKTRDGDIETLECGHQVDSRMRVDSNVQHRKCHYCRTAVAKYRRDKQAVEAAKLP